MGRFTEKDKPIKVPNNNSGDVTHFKEFSSGAGSTVLKANSEGFFVGGTNYNSAPWTMDYTGESISQSGTLSVGSNIVIDGVTGTIAVGDNVLLDGANDKITVGASNDVIIDGATGTVTTSKLIDSTYGLYGVFSKTYMTTQTTGTEDVVLVSSSGGLLNATLSYVDASGFYNTLPAFNTATLTKYYYVYKSGGNYKLRINNANITALVAFTNLYFTAFFNSLETNGW